MAKDVFDGYLSEMNNGYWEGGNLCVANSDCFSGSVKLCRSL